MGRQPKQFGWVHEIACPSENEIYTAEILNWRVQKLICVASSEMKIFVGYSCFRPRPCSVDRNVTFYRDVLPILQERCQGCHRPGEVGPMAFGAYDQTRALGQGHQASRAAWEDAALVRRLAAWQIS